MPFVATEDVLEAIRAICEERYLLRIGEVESLRDLPAVLKWVSQEFAYPEMADRGDYPKGFVNFDPERTSERREQDSGETATIGYCVEIYFHGDDLTAAEMNRRATRYGDGLLWTLMRESKLRLPKNDVAQPGLFRGWPETMRIGQVKETDLYGCEVRGKVIVDSQFTASV